jgi:hypothetical protein
MGDAEYDGGEQGEYRRRAEMVEGDGHARLREMILAEN